MLEREELLAAYPRHEDGDTWLRANFVTSLDGAATLEGLSGPLNDPEDTALLLALRQLADVVLVGAGTVRAEGYGGLGLDDAAQQWRTEHGLPALPRLAVVTRALDLDPGLALFEGPRPILVAPATAPATRRERLGEVADLLLCGEAEVDLTAVLAELTAQGLGQVLCEGGPELFASLVAVDAVDELCLTLSPLLVSGSATRITRAGDQVARRMRRAHVIEGTDMLFLRYTRAS